MNLLKTSIDIINITKEDFDSTLLEVDPDVAVELTLEGEQQQEVEEEQEVIEMDGYDTHEVDWSTPKGMRPVPEIIARIMILHRLAKIGMAQDDKESAILAKNLVQDLKNTPSMENREANSRARWKMDFTLWEKTTKREQIALTQKPFTPSKLNLKAQNMEMIYALLWVLKIVKEEPEELNFDRPAPIDSIKHIHKFLNSKDIWEMREYIPNFNLRKREQILELITLIEEKYANVYALYVRYVASLKPISNELVARLDILKDWYRMLKFATLQAPNDQYDMVVMKMPVTRI